jgi:hypothetical protein
MPLLWSGLSHDAVIVISYRNTGITVRRCRKLKTHFSSFYGTCSHEPAISPHPEAGKSSSHPPKLFLSNLFCILPSASRSSKWPFPVVFSRTKFVYALLTSVMRATCSTPSSLIVNSTQRNSTTYIVTGFPHSALCNFCSNSWYRPFLPQFMLF